MKKIYFGAAVTAMAIMTASTAAFGAEWYDAAVNYCKTVNYIPTDYDISGALTRGEMAEILSRAAGLSSDGIDNPFSDISADDSFTDDITALYEAGIYAGVKKSDGSLMAEPDAVLTREQASAFIIRAYGFKDGGENINFSDGDEISEYAVEDVKTLVNVGVISGYEDNTFRPQNNVLKTEFLTMVYKADEASGKNVTIPEKSSFTSEKMSDNLKLEVMNSETPYDVLDLKFTRFSADPGALYVYNPQVFQLEKNVNGEWIVVDRDRNEITEIGYQLKADSSSERKIALSDFYDGLESGKYRIVYEFSVNGVGIEKRNDYVSVEFDLAEAPAETELYDEIKEYLRNETEETFSDYYEIIDCEISEYKENDEGTEAVFLYKIIHKNFDKDPDTVEYIKEAKENGSPYYETYYREYLEPKEMNMYFRVTVDKNGELKLYTDVDPTNNTNWEETKMSDFILQ